MNEYCKLLYENIKNDFVVDVIIFHSKCVALQFKPVNHEFQYLLLDCSKSNPFIMTVNSNINLDSLNISESNKINKYLKNSIITEISNKKGEIVIKFTKDNMINYENYTLHFYIEKKQPSIILQNMSSCVLYEFLNVDNDYVNANRNRQIDLEEDKLEEDLNSALYIRKHEKYAQSIKFLKRRLKTCSNKLLKIELDKSQANNNLKYKEIADEILSSGFDLKSRTSFIELNGEKILLDPSKTILENTNLLYKKSKKAKKTLLLFEENIKRTNDEIAFTESALNFIEEEYETDIDKYLVETGIISGKNQTKQTSANTPYYINYKGTIILFGKNAIQNDYLSFVYKLDRNYFWLHVDGYKGAHIIIKNTRPTEKEFLLACELALYLSKLTTGNIVICRKKDIKRTKTPGLVKIRNHVSEKINCIRTSSIEIFKSAKKLD